MAVLVAGMRAGTRRGQAQPTSCTFLLDVQKDEDTAINVDRRQLITDALTAHTRDKTTVQTLLAVMR